MDHRSFIASMLARPALSARAAPHSPFHVKRVRLIVPFSAGSQTDVLSRLVGQKLTELRGEQVVVDNRPSADGTIALQAGASAQADGYTLLTHSSGNAIAPAL